MGDKSSKDKLQPMFRALEEYVKSHQTLNEIFLIKILCATGICLGSGHFS